MKSIKELPTPKKAHSFSFPAVWLAVPTLLVLLIVGSVYGLSSGLIHKKPATTNSGQKLSASGTTTAPVGNAGSNPSGADGSSSDGTDNASLASELNSVNDGLNQDQQSLNDANTAMNNQQQDNVPAD